MSSLLMTLLVGQLYIGKIGERVYIDSLKCFALNSPNQRFYICVNTQLAQFDLIVRPWDHKSWAWRWRIFVNMSDENRKGCLQHRSQHTYSIVLYTVHTHTPVTILVAPGAACEYWCTYRSTLVSLWPFCLRYRPQFVQWQVCVYWQGVK